MSRPTKRSADFQGFQVNVEIEAGDVKSGTDESGQAWSHTYQFPYGEIQRTEGEDGDPVDVYLGADESAEQVHVVHQNRADGSFDEDKVFLGFAGADEAEKAYRDHGPDFGFGSMESMTVDEFRNGYLAACRAGQYGGQGDYGSPEEQAEAGNRRYGG